MIKWLVGIIVSIVALVLLIYFVVDFSLNDDLVYTYNLLGTNSIVASKSNFEKQVRKIDQYKNENGQIVITLGDTISSTPTDGNVEDTGGSTTGGGEKAPPSVTSSDIRGAAIAVADLMRKPAGSTFEYPDKSPAKDSIDTSKPFLNYSQSGGGLKAWDNGKGTTHVADRRDCSSYVIEVLKYAGVVSSMKLGMTSSTVNTIAKQISVSKMSELHAGDILHRTGHVAIVTYVDSEFVYVADFGSASTSDLNSNTVGKSGDRSAENGYAYRFRCSDAWVSGKTLQEDSGYNRKFTSVYRPGLK